MPSNPTYERESPRVQQVIERLRFWWERLEQGHTSGTAVALGLFVIGAPYDIAIGLSYLMEEKLATRDDRPHLHFEVKDVER